MSSVLVDGDALAHEQSALTHARDLAARCGARLDIVDVLPFVPPSARHFATADVEQELVEHRTDRLQSLGAGVNAVEVATELLRGRPTALIQEVLAWTAFGARVLRSRVPEHEFVEYIDAARRAVDDAMQTFTTTHADRLKEVSVQLVQGEPERARSHFIDRNGIDSVVMGTVARAGIRGLVIGNTAERVLQRLRGSVLAVKPPGFVSPVAGFLSRRSRAWMLSVGVRRTSTASDTSCEAKPRASYVGLCIKACSGEPWCVP